MPKNDECLPAYYLCTNMYEIIFCRRFRDLFPASVGRATHAIFIMEQSRGVAGRTVVHVTELYFILMCTDRGATYCIIFAT